MCPFTIFIKTCKQVNPEYYITSVNPNNGFFSHYWKFDECEHILWHLTGNDCPEEQRRIDGVNCLQISHDGKHVTVMLSNGIKCIAPYKKSTLLVKKLF